MSVNPKLGLSAHTGGSADDILLPSEIRALDTRSVQYVYNPATGLLEYVRTPSVFKGVTVTTGQTTITLWTPATGKKFRLLQFEFQLPLSAYMAAAGILTQTLYDGANPTQFVFTDYLPNTTPTNAIGDNHTIRTLPLNGYLSTIAGNALSIHLSAALANGVIRWNACGTEE